MHQKAKGHRLEDGKSTHPQKALARKLPRNAKTTPTDATSQSHGLPNPKSLTANNSRQKRCRLHILSANAPNPVHGPTNRADSDAVREFRYPGSLPRISPKRKKTPKFSHYCQTPHHRQAHKPNSKQSLVENPCQDPGRILPQDPDKILADPAKSFRILCRIL